MRITIHTLPLALAVLIIEAPATFGQAAGELANVGTICISPANITASAYITIPPNNGSGFRFNSLHSTRTLPFTANIMGRNVNDIVSLTNISATISGGPGCKLDVLNPVVLTFQPVPDEPGVFQANGQLQVSVGADTVSTTNRGTTYICAIGVTFNPPTTITDIGPSGCGTIMDTINVIPLSFPWYRQ